MAGPVRPILVPDPPKLLRLGAMIKQMLPAAGLTP